MSTSAVTAAKKRRAGNIVASPLFRPNVNNMDSSQRRVNRTTENLQNDTVRQLNTGVSPVNTQHNEDISTSSLKKPMSLQQVITVFDKRLLTLEKAIIENKVPMETQNVSVNNVSVNNEVNIEHTQKMMEILREDLKITLTDQSKEFDYRTNMLATEITSLKEIVLKLQSYTLEVNQTLLEERQHFFNETENSIHIQSDEKLDVGDLEIIDNADNISMEFRETHDVEEEDVQEAALVEEEDVQETAGVEEDEDEEETAVVEEEPILEKKGRRTKKEKKSLSVNL